MNPFKTVKKMGEKKLNSLVAELIQNETFMKGVERVFSTKEVIDRQSEVFLNAVNIASRLESKDLSDRLDVVDRQLRKLSKKLEEATLRNEALQAEVEALKKRLPGEQLPDPPAPESAGS